MKRKKWSPKETSFTEKNSYTLWLKATQWNAALFGVFSLKSNSEGIFGNVRSCVMFSPHHSSVAWKSWLLFFPEKMNPSEKGAVNACYILCCFEKSVIASSFWGIYCRKQVSHLYQESPLDNTELILSEMVQVKHSITLPSANST